MSKSISQIKIVDKEGNVQYYNTVPDQIYDKINKLEKYKIGARNIVLGDTSEIELLGGEIVKFPLTVSLQEGDTLHILCQQGHTGYSWEFCIVDDTTNTDIYGNTDERWVNAAYTTLVNVQHNIEHPVIYLKSMATYADAWLYGFMVIKNCDLPINDWLPAPESQTANVNWRKIEKPSLLPTIKYTTTNGELISASGNDNIYSNEWNDDEECYIIELRDYITSLPGYMFYYSNRLETIKFSNCSNITSISDAFLSHSSLISCDLSELNNVSAVGDYFLHNCSSIKTIDLSPLNNVKYIGVGFLEDTKLTTIISPNNYITSKIYKSPTLDKEDTIRNVTSLTLLGDAIHESLGTQWTGEWINPDLKIYVPNNLLEEYKSTFPELSNRFYSMITVNWEVKSGQWDENEEDLAYDHKRFVCQSPGGNRMTTLRCTFKNAKSITFAYRSDAESTYDYLIVSKVDTSIFDMTSWNASSVYNHAKVQDYTRGVQNTWKSHTYEINDANEHFVEFMFGKDSGTDTQPDNAQVYISNIS